MCSLILLLSLFLSLSFSSCVAVTTTIQADVQAFVGGDGSNVAGNSDTSTGPGESSLFKSISGISVDTFYNVMCVTDSEAHEVRLVNLPSRFVERLGGVAEIQGYGSGTLTPYYDQPSSCFTTILTDFSDDRVTFVADSGNCMLRYIIGTNSLPLSGPTPPDHQGPRTTPCFNQQDGNEGENVRWSDRIGPMMVTPGKNLLVVDTGAFTLRLVSLGVGTSLSLGATHTVAGTLGISGNNDGIGTSAQFQFPTQFEYIESTSTLYIIDQHRIRMVVIPNNEWDGEWHVTTLGITLPFIPSGIAIDTTTKIMYLTSTSHVLYAVTNYDTDPILTVIAGVEGMMGWTNGIGNVARFFDPRDIQLKRDTASTNALLFINDHENHKIRLVNVTVSKSSGASGDPQFVGFQGQSYQVHGQPDEIFNLISSPTLSCNANFVYIQSGKCEYNHTQCWTHPGTYVDALGFRIGNNIADRIKMVAGSYMMGLRIWYNNTEVMVGQEIMMMDGTVMMTRVSYDRVDIITPQFKIGVVNSDSFFNLEIALLDTAALNAGRIRHTGTAVDKYPKFPYHGLIGQTWKNAIYLPSQSYIEGDIDDYRVESHTLFGLDYTYNYFGHEDGEEKMSVI